MSFPFTAEPEEEDGDIVEVVPQVVKVEPPGPDPILARNYAEVVKNQIEGSNNGTSIAVCDHCTSNSPHYIELQTESLMWRSSKQPTEVDHNATLTLLSLRKQFDEKFKDRKTRKNAIWDIIVQQMNILGFYVGEGIEGRLKVRQKFANLQATYLKTLQKRKKTGEGKIQYPPYFDEINEILGDKHKVNPPFVFDSAIEESTSNEDVESMAGNSSETSENNYITQSMNNPCSSKKNQRFNNVKRSVRPKKQSVCETLTAIHQENLENRRAEFKIMVEMMQEESKQRHNELMALIASIGRVKAKKRKESSSDSS